MSKIVVKEPPASNQGFRSAMVDTFPGFLRQRQGLLLCVLLFALVLWAFFPATRNGFVGFDDPEYVTANRRVQQGLTWENFKWALSSSQAANWHPMTWLSHMLDCQLFGLGPWGHHLTSVLLHAANTMLAFVVLKRMTGSTWRSLIVATFFGLHPLRVESVAWIAERKDVLSAFFFMLTLWTYVRYAEESKSVSEKSPPSPPRLSLPTSWMKNGANPEGILQQSPGLRGTSYPGSSASGRPNPNGVASVGGERGHNPVGVETWFARLPRVARRLATLGWRTQSLWDWTRLHSGIVGNAKPPREQRDGERRPLSHRPHRIPNHARRYYALSLLPFALGLMSKPMLVTLPFILILLDYWPMRRFPIPAAGAQGSEGKGLQSDVGMVLHSVAEKMPFILLAVVVSVITVIVQKSGGAMLSDMPLAERAGNALVSYCRYLGKLFWPIHLAVFYPPAAPWSVNAVLAASLLLLAVSALAIMLRGPQPWLLVGWLWFVGTLAPVIGLVPAGEQSMADRYSYLPSIGVALALVWGVNELIRPGRETFHRLAISVEAKEVVKRVLGGAAFAAAVWLCAALTRVQIGHWKNTESLFRHAILVTRNNYLAHYNLGTALDKQGRLDEALRQFQEALKEKPGYAEAYNNLGVVLDEQGRLDEGISQYLQALKLKPNFADAHNNLGAALDKQGRVDQAADHYQQALRLNPDHAAAHYNLGAALGRQGRLDDAIREFQTVLQLQPNSADAYNNLGVTLDKQGRLDEAITQYQAALKLKTDYAMAHFNLGIALSRKGQLDEAVREFQQALRLKPDFAEAQKNLASVLSMKKSLDAKSVLEEKKP